MRNCLLLMFISMTVFSPALRADDYLDATLLAQLCDLQDSCIVNVKEGKYYFNSEKVTIADNKIFLDSDAFGLLPVPCLMQDAEGIYLSAYAIFRCNSCGTYYSYKPSKCKKRECDSTSFTEIEQLPPD